LSITELVDYKIIVICIYRSPNGKFEVFLSRLEIVIQKLQNKKKRLILSGDWNINFLHDSPQVTEINNLLTRFNLTITVKVPMRITKTSSSLLDVIITNNEKLLETARIMELGMSDHYAQILSIPIDPSQSPLCPRVICKSDKPLGHESAVPWIGK
jgi:exonuclease III